MIPVRHSLNLLEEDESCNDSLQSAKDYYRSGGFTTWEVNARNLMQEMASVITTQKAWALPDAIGLAYVPYNQVKFNAEGHTDNFAGGADNAFDLLLHPDSDGQFAGISSAGYRVVEGSYGYRAYYFSLVVAYGVHYQFLRDTSYGATNYNHRPYDDKHPERSHCEVTGEYYTYAFFKDARNPLYNREDRTFTSAELEARGGWPAWARTETKNDNAWHYDEWPNGELPYGCTWSK